MNVRRIPPKCDMLALEHAKGGDIVTFDPSGIEHLYLVLQEKKLVENKVKKVKVVDTLTGLAVFKDADREVYKFVSHIVEGKGISTQLKDVKPGGVIKVHGGSGDMPLIVAVQQGSGHDTELYPMNGGASVFMDYDRTVQHFPEYGIEVN